MNLYRFTEHMLFVFAGAALVFTLEKSIFAPMAIALVAGAGALLFAQMDRR